MRAFHVFVSHFVSQTSQGESDAFQPQEARSGSAGPSATADVDATLAHGVRSLNVFSCGKRRPLRSDSNLFGIDDNEPRRNIDVVNEEQSAGDRRPNLVLGWRMNFEADHAAGLLRREPNHVCEVCVERYQRAAILDSETQDILVRSA